MPRWNEELDSLWETWHKPVIVTEFGADTMAGMHGHPNVMWTEEYQAELIRGSLEVAARKPYVAGMQVWNFADFAAVQSIMRVGGLNMKGIFTRTRTPKMAAHVLRRVLGEEERDSHDASCARAADGKLRESDHGTGHWARQRRKSTAGRGGPRAWRNWVVAPPQRAAPQRSWSKQMTRIPGMRSPDRCFHADPAPRSVARELYAGVRDLPIISPHGRPAGAPRRRAALSQRRARRRQPGGPQG